MGLKTILPKGTFYCYPNIKSTGMSSDNGEGFVRVSFATDIEKIKEALDRIENVI